MPPKKISSTHTRLLKISDGMSIIARHSIPDTTTQKKWLTRGGEQQAYWAGQNLPPGFKLEVLAAKAARAQNTGHIAEKGYADAGIPKQKTKPTYKSSLEKILSSFDFRDPIEKLKIGGEAVITDLTQRVYAGIGKKEKPLILSITHDGAVYAILSALRIINEKEDLEAKFGKRKPTKMLKDTDAAIAPTEGILFYFLNEKNGKRVILSFRRQRYDVTAEIKRILAKK